MNDCIFCKIGSGEIKKEFVYETDDVMVFPDLYPSSPTHLLIIPKKHVSEFLTLEDPELFFSLAKAVQEMIRKFELDKKGYRITVNGGGAQEVHHLHIHLRGPIVKPEK